MMLSPQGSVDKTNPQEATKILVQEAKMKIWRVVLEEMKDC